MVAHRIIKETERYLKQKLSREGTGHDWWHVDRVRKMALKIARSEGGDRLVIELAAMIHDIADWKFHGGDESVGPLLARRWLNKLKLPQELVDHVCHIVEHISFKGAGAKNKISTLEGKIVQDADRLDVLGAIGIARVFAYGGFKQRPIYDPAIKPVKHLTARQYKRGSGTSINHFYEKLLLVRDRLNTKTAKRIVQSRHRFLEQFLNEFFLEWHGKR